MRKPDKLHLDYVWSTQGFLRTFLGIIVLASIATSCGTSTSENLADNPVGENGAPEVSTTEQVSSSTPDTENTADSDEYEPRPTPGGTGSNCKGDTVPVDQREDSMSSTKVRTGSVTPLQGEGSNVPVSYTVLSDGRLAAGYRNGYIRVWDLLDDDSEPLELFRVEECVGYGDTSDCDPEEDYICGKTYRQNKNTTVLELAELPDGRIASGFSDGTIRIWDPARPTTQADWLTNDTTVLSLLALDNGGLVSGDIAGTLKVWDPADVNAAPVTIAELESRVYSIHMLSDGRILSGHIGFMAVTDLDGSTGSTIYLTPTDTTDTFALPDDEEEYVLLDLVELGDRTVLAGASSSVLLFDLEDSASTPTRIDVAEGSIHSNVVPADGDTILLAADSIHILNTATATVSIKKTDVLVSQIIPYDVDRVVLIDRDRQAVLANIDDILNGAALSEADPGSNEPITHENILEAIGPSDESGIYYLGSCDGEVVVQELPVPPRITPFCGTIESSTGQAAVLYLTSDEIGVDVTAYRDGDRWVIEW